MKFARNHSKSRVHLERSKERSVRQVEKYRTQPLVSFARKSSNHRKTTRRPLVSSDQKDKGRICRRNGPVRNHRGTSFRKEDFDPRTTVTVKEKYSEGREALEEIIPRAIPEVILLTTSVRPQGERVTQQTTRKTGNSLRKFFTEGAKLARSTAPVL